MYHYIHLKIYPPSPDILTLRKTIGNSLSQTFGLLAEGTYIDVLSFAEDGDECILRVRPSDVSKVLGSLVTWNETQLFSLIKETPFLPSLLASSII